jgi:hypothetical protein
MAAREFVDPHGRSWTAWEVLPGQHTTAAQETRLHLPDEMASGWLVFDGVAGKRRSYPIPAEWDRRSDAELWSLCEAAEPVVPREKREAAGE